MLRSLQFKVDKESVNNSEGAAVIHKFTRDLLAGGESIENARLYGLFYSESIDDDLANL